MRASLLRHDPEIHAIGMSTLVGIANAIEHESMRRYAQLARTMERRGEAETAAAFRTMLDEEQAHLAAIERWAAGLGVQVPPHESFEWSLPADLSASWDDIAGSALLTPYRAFAIAVENEQRAFAFYAYLAAHASDERVAAQAERLAAEELRHAARVRRWRRAAWHRERPAHRSRTPDITTIDALRGFLAQRHADVAACHRAIAARLRQLGDDESVRLLEQFAAAPLPACTAADAGADAAAHAAAFADPDAAGAGEPDAATLAFIDAAQDPVHLLVAAQKPLESLSEALESVLATAEGALFDEAERAAHEVVARLARLALQTARRMHSAAP